jgi:hypothetical protein
MEIKEITALITEREKEWMQAWINKDEEKFNEILAEECPRQLHVKTGMD